MRVFRKEVALMLKRCLLPVLLLLALAMTLAAAADTAVLEPIPAVL